MSILAGLAGAAGNFAFDQLSNSINSRRQQRYNERNMELQQKHQKEMIDYVADKNSPMKSAARWRAAGISPADVFGNSPGGAGIASDASGPSSSNPDGGSSRYDFVRTIAESQMMRNQQRLTDAEVNLKNAQAKEAEARATGQTNENSIFDLIKSAKESAAGIAAFEKKIKGIEAKWLESEKAKDMEAKDAALREVDQLISNLMADEAYKNQATEKLRSEMDLIKAQIATESSKQHNLDASTRNLDADTKTENELRKLRKSLTQNQVIEIRQKIKESKVLTAEGIEKLYAWLRGDREASSLFGVIDKYLTGAGKSLMETQYNGDVRRYLYDLLRD